MSDIKRDNWFTVSVDGLSEHYKKVYTARELLANVFDEEATEITFTIERSTTVRFPRQYLVRIIDNDPNGFDNIDDMFTLFRKTKKMDDTQVRGRFNHGEKGVLSLCNKAVLTSTKGTVKFTPNGNRTIDLSLTTKIGSDLQFWLDLDEKEVMYLLNYIQLVKIPNGITVRYCGKTYTSDTPQFEVSAKLQTWKSNQKTAYYKQTDVHLYPKIKDVAYIMELGIPIQKINYPFTIDVRQKIPLDTKRNSVKNSYLEDLFGQLANHDFVIKNIKDSDLGEDYVAITLSSTEITNESARKLVERKLGSDKIIFANPFDQKANEKAVEHGYTLIQSRDIPKNARQSIKNAGIQTSSEVFKDKLENANYITHDNYTEGMKWIENWSLQFALFSINRSITVTFCNNSNASELASYGSGILNYNMGTLGNQFFDTAKRNIAKISEYLIHELAHDLKEKDQLPHLSSAYLKELERIAGKMVEWLMIPENYHFVYDKYQS